MTRPLPLCHPVRVAATFFWSGQAPFAPGTSGSLAALPFAWLFLWLGGWQLLLAAAVVVTLVGFWSAGRYAESLGYEDPGSVVIDEVAGQWIALLPAALDPVSFAIGFAAFRILDITKPFPASWADKKLTGALGIMLDDIFAGIYAALIVLAAQYFLLSGA
ncbi:phosphatidylglycerophosphatase A [Nisaea sp.]|uniref:phosphatidylglycerophosphatase A family protein n=2 Tax=Nisaea sp. TaxID=2024842 RepID=UPI003266A648